MCGWLLSNFPVYAVVFECSRLHCLALKRGKEKNEVGKKKECQHFKSSGSHFSWRGRGSKQQREGDSNGFLPPPCSEAGSAIPVQSPSIGGQGPFCPAQLLQEHKHSCLPHPWGWGKRALLCKDLRLSEINQFII